MNPPKKAKTARDEGNKPVFRPRARILQLLGDELIGSPRLAVFELVKNAYDADATKVTVKFKNIDSENPNIAIKDNGVGMSELTLRNIWLVLAHDNRGKQREAGIRTELGRLPLGEKGLGRLAVHKLGDKITLHTRAKGEPEMRVVVDWGKLAAFEFLEDAEIEIEQLTTPKYFKGEKTGTIVTVTKLRGKIWSRGEIRRLYRQIQSISSPNPKKQADFSAKLLVPQNPEWIEDLPNAKTILKRALWKFDFIVEGGKFSWDYKFSGLTGTRVPSRNASEEDTLLLLPPPIDGGFIKNNKKQKITASEKFFDGIGPVSGAIYAYDRDPEILAQFANSSAIKGFLDEQGGVRIYRDDIRVYNYGEREDDWLNLDLRRVNSPTRNLSRNLLFGWIDMDLEPSTALVEKTNREGFVENDAYDRLRRIVLGALTVFETERGKDKKLLREALDSKKGHTIKRTIKKPIEELTKEAKRLKVFGHFQPIISRIEKEYNEMRETSSRIGLSGLGLAVVFHEVEQGVRGLYKDMEAGVSIEDLLKRARRLMKMLDGFAELLRQDEQKTQNLSKLIKRARDVSKLRFRGHNVELHAPPLEEDVGDTFASFTFPLLLNALTNILDNAFYWMDVKAESDPEKGWRGKIFIDVDTDRHGNPRLLVADNGPGFKDTPEELTQAFFTRRPSGIGLGLYFVKLAMEVNEGFLDFPSIEETDLPAEASGAIVALVFGESQ